MEGTERERECSVARLVLYCVTVCILVLGVECVTVSRVVFMDGTERERVLCGTVSAVLCDIVYISIGC